MGFQLYKSTKVPAPPRLAAGVGGEFNLKGFAERINDWLEEATKELNSQSQTVFDVRDYGGKPNTSADNIKAIRKAVADAKKDHGGGDIYLSNGTWRISSGISLDYPNIRLIGAGRAATRASWSTFGPTVLLCDFSDSSDPAVHITERNCAVEQMEIYGAPGSSTSDGIFVNAATQTSTVGLARIKKVNISNFSNHGIRIHDGELSLIEDTYIESCGGSAVTMGWVDYGGIDNTLRRVRARYCGAPEHICINRQIGTMLDCVEALDSNQTGDSYGIYMDGCRGTTIINPDLERPSTTTGIYMTRVGKDQLLGGYFGELQCGIQTAGDSGNKLENSIVMGGVYASACSLGIYIGANTHSLMLLNPDWSNCTTEYINAGAENVIFLSNQSFGLGTIPAATMHLRVPNPVGHVVSDAGQDVEIDLGEQSGSGDTTAHGMQLFTDGSIDVAGIKAKRNNSYVTALAFPYNDANTLGWVGVGINYPKAPLHVSGNTCIPFSGSYTPATGTSAGTVGMICYDTDYIYLCTSNNSWSRATLSTF